MFACLHGHSDIAMTLLDDGAIVDHQEKVKDLEYVLYTSYHITP